VLLHPSTGRVLFSATELNSPDEEASTFAPGFLDSLLRLRVAFDEPININSCARSPAHNEKVGGAPGSFHLTINPVSLGTCAIDIAVPDAMYARKLAVLALNWGWTVGVYPTFLHLDRRLDHGREPLLFHGKVSR